MKFVFFGLLGNGHKYLSETQLGKKGKLKYKPFPAAGLAGRSVEMLRVE